MCLLERKSHSSHLLCPDFYQSDSPSLRTLIHPRPPNMHLVLMELVFSFSASSAFSYACTFLSISLHETLNLVSAAP